MSTVLKSLDELASFLKAQGVEVQVEPVAEKPRWMILPDQKHITTNNELAVSQLLALRKDVDVNPTATARLWMEFPLTIALDDKSKPGEKYTNRSASGQRNILTSLHEIDDKSVRARWPDYRIIWLANSANCPAAYARASVELVLDREGALVERKETVIEMSTPLTSGGIKVLSF